MGNSLKTNGAAGAMVGHHTIFTRQGAIELYTAFVAHCYEKLDIAGAAVLAQVESDMVAIGFTHEELEAIELGCLKAS